MPSRHVVVVGSPWILRLGMKQMARRLGLGLLSEGDTLDEAFEGLTSAADPAVVVILLGRGRWAAEDLQMLLAARTRFAKAKLVVLSEMESSLDVEAAMDMGVDALLSPKMDSRSLVNSLQLVLIDQKLFPKVTDADADRPVIQDREVDHVPSPPQAKPEPAPTSQIIQLNERATSLRHSIQPVSLVWNNGRASQADAHSPGTPSEREWEILRCLARGGSNKSIARELGIAETTVKVHVKSLLRKLRVANRTQAAIWALSNDGGADRSAAAKV